MVIGDGLDCYLLIPLPIQTSKHLPKAAEIPNNTRTWDDVQFDGNGWTATDHDFRIGNLSAPDFRFGFPLNIPMSFSANDLNAGDRIEISPDYSTFASEISGFRFFPTEQPTIISEQTDPVTAILI
ncbi:hypothetical protein OOK60_11460 [Trichothermofontia sichuanensis B231]|uniref:hypothetical protein n=1 Tax=Trichothermofontia sichuanensis TaxID=3045816 RepID=UPI002245ECF4|nr:hypothetical protein [Trichothermofontia sichuanensis]UZQ53132.1 hypothetical protein OOK60_11460 [Trichothermofontia sichuanensis B231]